MADSIYDGKELRGLLNKTFGKLIIPYKVRRNKEMKKKKNFIKKE